MLRLPPFTMGHTVADLAHDYWQKRKYLISLSRPQIYLPFRLSATNIDTEESADTYVHYVIMADIWFYTISETAPVHLRNHNDLVFDPEAADTGDDHSVRGGSRRHYLFQDRMSKQIGNTCEQMCDRIGASREIALWDFFPVKSIYLSLSAHERFAFG